jgi:hypothetical protein
MPLISLNLKDVKSIHYFQGIKTLDPEEPYFMEMSNATPVFPTAGK